MRGFLIGDMREDVDVIPDTQIAAALNAGANCGRAFFRVSKDSTGTNYLIGPKTLQQMDALVAQAKRLGFTLILCMSMPDSLPGGTFWNAPNQASWISLWQWVAARYKNAPLMFDLINEPVFNNDALPQYQALWAPMFQACATAVRAISTAPILFEPTPYAQPWTPAGNAPQVSNLILSVHMYWVTGITHMGVYGNPINANWWYPNSAMNSGGITWDKAGLKNRLDIADAWARAHSLPVIVGEFGCVPWATNGSRDKWLQDCIDLFEAYGWGWIYCSWRMAPEWSPEVDQCAAPPAPGNGNSSTMQLLRNAMSRNWTS